MKILTALFFVAVVALAALAQPFQPHVLYNFTGQGFIVAPLVLGPDGNFYGTTPSGGSARRGTVFRMTPAGSVTTVVNFTGPDGQAPGVAGMVMDSDGNFYGTTDHGGSGARGTVFKVMPNGNLTTLVNFNNTNGAAPEGVTIGSDGNLYGTTITGTNYYGTVFKVTPQGVFSTLLNFPADYGSFPAGLTPGRDGSLYGKTYNGSTGNGTIFRVTTNGTLTILAAISGSSGAYSPLTLGNDGNFYGTTFEGGTSGRGTAFRVTPEGSLTTLVNFDVINGANPAGPITLGSDGNFYGTTTYGGIFEGTVFKMTPDGTLTTLANFTSRSIGVRPYAGVTFGADGSLYGTTITGGSSDGGVIFRLDLPPMIISQPASRINVIATTATFMVSAIGTRPLSYQWVKDGMNLADGGNVSGANTATLTLANVQPNDAGNYAVVVANNFGSVTSFVAVLTVAPIDADGDGVADSQDRCPNTAPGAIVDEHGCSIEQLVPCEGPYPGVRWKNHGQYVSAVAGLVRHLVTQGVISEEEAVDIVVAAAQSDCGHSRN